MNNVEHKTFDESGNFIKRWEFEIIWVDRNVYGNYGLHKSLTDLEYIDYKLWEDINYERLFKEHIPNGRLYMGKNPNIIFHGGCLGCLSQRINGLERCMGCQYFRANWSLPNLKIDGEESAKISADEIRNFLKNN